MATQNNFKSSNICGNFINSDYPDNSVLANGVFNRDLHIKGNVYIGNETGPSGAYVDTGANINFTINGIVYTLSPTIMAILINLSSQSLATQAYVNTQISNLVSSAPSTLDTLNELATALGNDANFSTTMTNLIGTKASLTGNQTIYGINNFSNTSNVYYGDGTHLSGIIGSAGATGATGSSGLSGLPGINGTNGTNGINGTNGATGANGANGTVGATGASGSNATLPTNIDYIDVVQTITANKTFNNSSLIMNDGTINMNGTYNTTTLHQNNISSALEFNQNYTDGYIYFNTKTPAGVLNSGSYSSTFGFRSSTMTISDLLGTLNSSRLLYTSPILTITNIAPSGSITFETSDNLVSSKPFTINSTNCSFTNPPLCSIAPTTATMLTNKAYVDGKTTSTQKLTSLTVSSDLTGTKPTLSFGCDANSTYIQSGSIGAGGSGYPANIVFSPINAGNYPYCIMSPMGISMFYAPVFMYDTLPTPTVNQLGYNQTIAGTYPTVATTFGNNSFTSLIPAGVLIPAGIYSISFSTYVTQIGTTSGSINYIACGLSTTQTGFINGVNVFQNSYVYFPASAPYPYLLATTTKTLYVNVPTTYYFVINLNHLNLTLQIKGSLNNFQYTKIA